MCFKTRGLYKCGKCPECLAERQVSWSLRLIEYAKTHKCFSALLTYNNDNVPRCDDGMSLSKRDVQLFLKRLRYEFPENKIKYYIAGEYSPEKFRPHYHCLLFGLPENLSQKEAIALLEKNWQKGYVGCYSNWLKSNAQINYALGYFIYLYDWKDIDKRVKPFSLISKGLSYIWNGDEFNKILDPAYKYVRLFGNDECVVKGKRVRLPRYAVSYGSQEYYDRCNKDVVEPVYYDVETSSIRLLPELEYLEEFSCVVVPQSRYFRKKNITIDLPPKRFKLPRCWSDSVIPKDIKRAINFHKQYLAEKKELEYQEKYGEYDKNSDIPMWKQIKYAKYCKKKKNKKSKLLSDPLTYFE